MPGDESGPALVLHPPKVATPICTRCRTPLERQPLVRPLPLLILLSVGSVLVLSSVPMLFNPSAPVQPEHKDRSV